MGFLTGSVTFERFRVTQDPTGEFGDEHLGILKDRVINSSGTNLYESPAMGFSGGSHLLDTNFSFDKNIIGDAIHFGIRTDAAQIPSPIKHAWMQMELDSFDIEPGMRPTKTQRQEAKEAVESRCASEAADGNFRRMSVVPVLWDATTETVFLGSTSEKANDACVSLIESACGLEMKRVTSGALALEFAETVEQTESLYDASPTSFQPDLPGSVVWWNGMGDNYDYLGNEFLLWLWWQFETKSDTFSLSDDSEVSGMFARSLSLDCPMGESGRESISSESPVALPEANLAIRMGKLPRKAGLTLVRDGQQFDLTLKAETFSIGSARISQIGDAKITDRLDRIESVRQLAETIDLLYEVFCQSRFSKAWSKNVDDMKVWLQSETRLRKLSKRAA